MATRNGWPAALASVTEGEMPSNFDTGLLCTTEFSDFDQMATDAASAWGSRYRKLRKGSLKEGPFFVWLSAVDQLICLLGSTEEFRVPGVILPILENAVGP